jgi:hypothetical protein
MAEPTFQIPKDVIEPIITAHIAAAVSAALAGRERIVEMTVSQLLNMKVDSEGKPSSYDRGQTFIQWVMNDTLRKAVRDIMTEELKKHEAIIRAELASQLTAKKSPLLKQLIEQLTTGLVTAASSTYRLNVSVESVK